MARRRRTARGPKCEGHRNARAAFPAGKRPLPFVERRRSGRVAGLALSQQGVDRFGAVGAAKLFADRAVAEQARYPRQRLQVIGAGCLRRSEEHTSEIQSLMRISYAVFCLKKKNKD